MEFINLSKACYRKGERTKICKFRNEKADVPVDTENTQWVRRVLHAILQLGKLSWNGWILHKIYITDNDQGRNRIHNYHSRVGMVIKDLLWKFPGPHGFTDDFFLTV